MPTSDQNSCPTEKTNSMSASRRDLAIVLLAATLTFLLSVHFDLFERFAHFAEDHDAYQLDEIATFLTCIGLGLALYVVRRWREMKAVLAEINTAQQKLRESNRELEQFAYIASHDLQEPLRVISGFAELLGRRYKGKLDSNADEYIAFMLDGCKRMQALISGLLTYSRVGRKSRPFASCELGLVIERAKANLDALITETNATVETGFLPKVFASEDELIQLFQNLIGNACKFHSEKPPVIKIRAQKSGQDQVRVAVADNGIGIDEQYHNRVFEVFERLHGRTEYEGTGIGLAVCKKIVERHKGKIWVESEPGIGSTFYMTLPTGNGKAKQ